MRPTLAIDQSLSQIGLCLAGDPVAGETRYEAWSVKPKHGGVARLAWVRDEIGRLILQRDVGLVAIEGYAYGRPNGMAALGELGGVIRLCVHDAGLESVVVPPSSVKKWATGRGNADKQTVLLAAHTRFGDQIKNDDQADAAWLAEIAHSLRMGEPGRTAAQRAVLDALIVSWGGHAGDAETFGRGEGGDA